jgi:hypothetical protein
LINLSFVKAYTAMFSAPPVLVEPKVVNADDASHIEEMSFEWVTETPEPSPVCLRRVPVKPVDEHLGSFKRLCGPVWEQMLTRIATHADILGAAEPAARHQLIETLCQPFFERTIETLSGEISSSGAVPSAPSQKTANGSYENDMLTLNLGGRLGFVEDDSTDAETDSAFATLFSSDGEDDCEVEQQLELSSQLSQLSGGLVAFDETPRDDEKSQMVCRHWKSKGWCRYESQCKFLHPASKCGVSVKVVEDCEIPAPSRSTRRRGGKSKRSVIALDSRLNLVDSYSMCPPFFLCQAM